MKKIEKITDVIIMDGGSSALVVGRFNGQKVSVNVPAKFMWEHLGLERIN